MVYCCIIILSHYVFAFDCFYQISINHHKIRHGNHHGIRDKLIMYVSMTFIAIFGIYKVLIQLLIGFAIQVPSFFLVEKKNGIASSMLLLLLSWWNKVFSKFYTSSHVLLDNVCFDDYNNNTNNPDKQQNLYYIMMECIVIIFACIVLLNYTKKMRRKTGLQ